MVYGQQTCGAIAPRLLFSIGRDELPTLTLAAKKEWVSHLEAAHKSWEIERLQEKRGQSVITKFFSRLNI